MTQTKTVFPDGSTKIEIEPPFTTYSAADMFLRNYGYKQSGGTDQISRFDGKHSFAYVFRTGGREFRITVYSKSK